MERKGLIDECMESFKRAGFPFTKFGKLEGKHGMIFDLPFADEGSMLIHMYEIDADTMGVNMFDLIPYRFVEKTIRENIINTVNRKMPKEILFYNEAACRFCTSFEMQRENLFGPDIGARVRQSICLLGAQILLCFK